MSVDIAADLYQQTILTHARHPLHRGRLDPADALARGENPLCGDDCEITLRYGNDGKIADIAFEGRGCAITLASADLMAALARGRAKPELEELAEKFETLARTGEPQPGLDTLSPFRGLADYPSRVKCATLPWAALLAALEGKTEATSE